MALNVERIRKQVQKAIDVAPFQVTLQRRVYEDDGRGGRIRTDKITTSFTGSCLFDNSGDGPFSLVQSEAGKKHEQSAGQCRTVFVGNGQQKRKQLYEYMPQWIGVFVQTVNELGKIKADGKICMSTVIQWHSNRIAEDQNEYHRSANQAAER